MMRNKFGVIQKDKLYNRVEWIDITKGIAMLCVVAGHLGNSNVNHVVYGFHLTVFFLLSGYTLKEVTFNSYYISNKFNRIMKPYFYTCFFVLLFDLINSIVIYHDAKITTLTSIIGRDLLRSFFASGTITTFGTIELGSRIGAIWFLPALFFAIILVQWSIYQFSSSKKQYIILSIIYVCSYVSAKFLWLPFSIQSGGMCAIFLLVGRDIKKYKIMKRLNHWHYIVMFLIAILGMNKGYTNIYYVSCNVPDIFLSLIVTLSMSILLFNIAQKVEKFIGIISFVKQGLLYIGQNSILYLCVHLFEMETLSFIQLRFLSQFCISESIFVWAHFALKMIIITGIVISLHFMQTVIIPKLFLNYNNKKYENADQSFRNITVDIERGILIIIMLVGHIVIDPTLRKVIYSFHMAAFIFLSGYFYKGWRRIRNKVFVIAKAYLIPYIIFCGLHLILYRNNILSNGIIYYIKQYICGISFSKKIFTEISSIGPVYLILLLLTTRLLYTLTDRILFYVFTKNQKTKFLDPLFRILMIIGISITGLYLGNLGWWLPWSIDIALYCVVFYHIGFTCKQYHILEWCCQNSWVYFIFALFWVYAIYSGNMEIAMRSYEPYGIVIIGAISGTILLYMLSEYLKQHGEPHIVKITSSIGESTLFILIIHTLLGGKIGVFYASWFDPTYIYHMIATISTQIILGIVIGIILNFVIKQTKRHLVL